MLYPVMIFLALVVAFYFLLGGALVVYGLRKAVLARRRRGARATQPAVGTLRTTAAALPAPRRDLRIDPA